MASRVFDHTGCGVIVASNPIGRNNWYIGWRSTIQGNTGRGTTFRGAKRNGWWRSPRGRRGCRNGWAHRSDPRRCRMRFRTTERSGTPHRPAQLCPSRTPPFCHRMDKSATRPVSMGLVDSIGKKKEHRGVSKPRSTSEPPLPLVQMWNGQFKHIPFRHATQTHLCLAVSVFAPQRSSVGHEHPSPCTLGAYPN